MRIKIDKADQIFSRWIRTRDKWTCQRCHTRHEERSQGLHNSHYWGRGKESTRFEPDNCDALCYGCHRVWEKDDRDAYKAFKIKQLGKKRYDSLDVQAHTTKKKDRKMEIIKWTAALKELNDPLYKAFIDDQIIK